MKADTHRGARLHNTRSTSLLANPHMIFTLFVSTNVTQIGA